FCKYRPVFTQFGATISEVEPAPTHGLPSVRIRLRPAKEAIRWDSKAPDERRAEVLGEQHFHVVLLGTEIKNVIDTPRDLPTSLLTAAEGLAVDPKAQVRLFENILFGNGAIPSKSVVNVRLAIHDAPWLMPALPWEAVLLGRRPRRWLVREVPKARA